MSLTRNTLYNLKKNNEIEKHNEAVNVINKYKDSKYQLKIFFRVYKYKRF